MGKATDRVRIDQMAHVIMEGLQEYADLATDDMKAAVPEEGGGAESRIIILEDALCYWL